MGNSIQEIGSSVHGIDSSIQGIGATVHGIDIQIRVILLSLLKIYVYFICLFSIHFSFLNMQSISYLPI